MTSKSKSPDGRTQDAYHEAGHFVAAMVLGADLPDVITIRRVSGTRGRVSTRMSDDLDSPEYCENQAVIMFSGWAAQLELDPSDPEEARRGSDDDNAMAAAFLAVAEHTTEDQCRTRARQAIKEHWNEVGVVAQALLDREELQGQEAASIAKAPRY